MDEEYWENDSDMDDYEDLYEYDSEDPDVRYPKEVPFAMAFITDDGNEELCDSTGREVRFEFDSGKYWYGEFVDSNGSLHYGN